LRAGRLFAIPIKKKLTRVDASLGGGLPFRIGMGRAHDVNATLLVTASKHLGVHGASIHELLTGQQLGVLQIGLNAAGHAHIAGGSCGRRHLDDEMRLVRFTGLP
jgi:hypothetical protein